MKSKARAFIFLAIGVLGLLALAGGSYEWATGLMDSLFAYRSPLANHPPEPGQPLGQPLTRRVVFVLVDALRLDTSLKTEAMPFLNELRRQGAWASMHSRPPSYSQPGYTVLLTGAWPDLSDGPVINLPYEKIPTFTQDDLFSAAHRAGLKTAVAGYYWFEKLIPQRAVDARFYTPGEDNLADREVVNAALDWLKGGKYHLLLVHIDQVDYAGHHEGGPRDPRWDMAARRADSLIREIVAEMDLSQDTLLVVSDHGQIDQGGHGGQDAITLIEPFVLVGAGVRPGQYGDVMMVDVAPTVAALLGSNIPASSQGRVLTEMLNISPEQERVIAAATLRQQQRLLEAYQEATGYNYKGETKVVQLAQSKSVAEIVQAYQGAMELMRATRLRRERLPRGFLALVVAAIPGLWMYHRRGKVVAWLLVGGFLYALIFNIRYAVIDRRTYSLSSVTSAEALIGYVAVTALIAMAVSWLVTFLGSAVYRMNPPGAALIGLGTSLVIIYLLTIPVLWSFALNGAIATWTLPDFASTFLGFISTLQILVISISGVVLSGFSALVAWIYSMKSGRRHSKVNLQSIER